LAMGCFDPVEAFLMPPFTFFSKVPATAVLPIFFVIVQINFSMYLAIIVFGMLPSLAQAISASVRKDVPDELIYKAYTLGASQFELIWNVIFKQVLPRILDAARLQIGPALVLLVAAEWMVAGEGIGYRLRLFYQRTDMTVVFVYVFILGLIGLATDYLLIWLRRRLCPWFGD
ncbi:MAG: ABC transporter permease subunit, partial [Planctomycetota bacterium]